MFILVRAFLLAGSMSKAGWDGDCLAIIVSRKEQHARSGKCRGGKAMPFSVGDKVVHPHHGPGWIASIERRELLDGTKRYYEIEMPGQGLTVYMPVRKADEGGVRLAISRSRLPWVLSMLRGKPRRLPEDYKERQEQIWAQLKTGRVMQLAKVVRDLTWHRARAHLTKIDSDYLKQGRDLLAAEMALVSGDAVSDASKLIEATMTAAMASTPN
jgi:CarD family transcriptional regulator, regulator of rRNA transcription